MVGLCPQLLFTVPSNLINKSFQLSKVGFCLIKALRQVKVCLSLIPVFSTSVILRQWVCNRRLMSHVAALRLLPVCSCIQYLLCCKSITIFYYHQLYRTCLHLKNRYTAAWVTFDWTLLKLLKLWAKDKNNNRCHIGPVWENRPFQNDLRKLTAFSLYMKRIRSCWVGCGGLQGLVRNNAWSDDVSKPRTSKQAVFN